MKPTILFPLAVAIVLVSIGTAVATLPFHTSFSEREGFFAGSTPEGGWLVRPQTTVVATEHYVEAGQSVLLYHGRPPGLLQRGFAPNGNEIVFVDLFVRPAAGETVNESTRIEFDSVGVAFLQDGEDATIAVTELSEDRQTRWVGLAYPVSTDVLNRADDWTRVTLRLDYSLERGGPKYDIYLNGNLAEYDLNFLPRRFNSGRQLTVTGASAAETWVDYIYAGSENPVFEDHGTGLPADWLMGQGLTPDPDARNDELIDGIIAMEAVLDELRPEYTESNERGRILEEGMRRSEQRLSVFTRLERPRKEALERINTTKD